jgi:excisionase family DNA binding protein
MKKLGEDGEEMGSKKPTLLVNGKEMTSQELIEATLDMRRWAAATLLCPECRVLLPEDDEKERRRLEAQVRSIARELARVNGSSTSSNGRESHLMTIRQAARYLSTSSKSIRKMIWQGELSVVRGRGRTSPHRIPVADLDAWAAREAERF